MTLLIAIGVAALALLIILVALIARSGDDGAGYTDETRSDFVNACGDNNPQPVCECMIGNVSRTVPFEDFKAYADDIEERRADGLPPPPNPEWLTSAQADCQAEESSTSS